MEPAREPPGQPVREPPGQPVREPPGQPAREPPGQPVRQPARVRVLVAKPGLDGHDRGAKIVARALRDAGFEVIFTGIRQRVEAIVATALQEDVAVVGLSILSGAHLGLTTRVVEGLRAAAADDIAVVVGGTIPAADVPRLRAAGAAAVYPTGTPLDVIVPEIRALASAQPSQPSQPSQTSQPSKPSQPGRHEETPCASA